MLFWMVSGLFDYDFRDCFRGCFGSKDVCPRRYLADVNRELHTVGAICCHCASVDVL